MASSKDGGTTIKSNRVPMALQGTRSKGQKIRLLTNHFKVGMNNSDGHFFHYSVSLNYEDGKPLEVKGIGQKVLDKVHQTYSMEIAGKDFAYDGEKSLFTIGELPAKKFEFNVVLEDISSSRTTRGSHGGSPSDADRKRSKKQPWSKAYKVVIKYAAKIPVQAIASALCEQDSEQYQEAVRVLDIILRKHAAKQGCLIVRQSWWRSFRMPRFPCKLPCHMFQPQ